MDNRDIKRLIENLAPQEGVTETGIEGVQLFRVSHPVERTPAVYAPTLCVIVNGSKRAYLDGEVYTYQSGHYLCCTMAMPIEVEIQHATAEDPVLGMMITLDTKLITEVALELETSGGALRSERGRELTPGFTVVKWDKPFTDSILRLLQLVGDRSAIGVLGRGRLRELYYAVLTGGAGNIARRSFGVGNEIAKTVELLRENIGKTVVVEDLASHAGMSRAVFHRKFKQATTMSPLQFIKTLKLNEAAMLIASGTTVNEAASEVGYISSSQFSREFRRLYGKSPRQWSNTQSAILDEVQVL